METINWFEKLRNRVLLGLLFGCLLLGLHTDLRAHFPGDDTCQRLGHYSALQISGRCPVHSHDLNDAEFRLVDVATGNVVDLDTVTAPSGRVEIKDKYTRGANNEWRGICDDGLGVLGTGANQRVLGKQEAEVVCRQLGFSGGTPQTGLASPEDKYLIDELQCAGSEDRILGTDKCKHRPVGHHDCEDTEAFGVTCSAATTNSDAVGRVAISGTLKVESTLTADHSGITDADGKPTADSAFSYQWIWVDISTWEETEISGATDSTYTLVVTDEEKYIKVSISFTDDDGNTEKVESFHEGPIIPEYPDGHIRRLKSNDVFQEWKPMIHIWDRQEGKWKGICDDHWETNDAKVACRQLGYSGGNVKAVTDLAGFYYPSRIYLLDDVACNGTESRLFDCRHAGRGVHDCGAREYAGVECYD